MDANEAAAAIAEQEPVVETKTDEVVEPEQTEEVLPSDEPEAKDSLTVEEELRKQIEGLEAKVKRGADKASDAGREKKEAAAKEEYDNALSDFYTENMEDIISGSLSEDAQKKAEELNLTDEQIELASLRAEKRRDIVYKAAGGKEKYDEIVEVMKDVYTDEQKAAYSKGISDPVLAPLLIEGLKAEYAKINKKEVNYSESAVASSGTSRGYTNRADYAKDMAKMRSAPSSQQTKLQALIDAKLNRSDSSVLMR